MKKAGRIFKAVLAAAMILAIGFAMTACSSNDATSGPVEKTLKVTAVNSHSGEVDLGFDGGIEDLLYIDFLEVYDDGTYKMTSTMNGYARWINMSVVSHVDVLYGSWTEGANSDEFSLFTSLSAPTRAISYSYSIADSEATPPVDSDKLSGDELTALLGNYGAMSVEIDYETGVFAVQ